MGSGNTLGIPWQVREVNRRCADGVDAADKADTIDAVDGHHMDF